MKKSLQTYIMEHCDREGSQITFLNRYGGGYMTAHQQSKCVAILGDEIKAKSAVIEILAVVMHASGDDGTDPNVGLAVAALLDYRLDKAAGNTLVFWPNLKPIDESLLV